jgi:lipoprotein-releasing system permease protein
MKIDLPWYPLAIGGRYLRRKRISYLAIVGVCLSVMTLIVVLSVMKGFDQQLRKRVRGQLSHLTLEPAEARLYSLEDWEAKRREILKVPHIVAVAPYIEGFALVKLGPRFLHAQFRGVDPALEADVSDIDLYLQNFFRDAEDHYRKILRERHPDWTSEQLSREAGARITGLRMRYAGEAAGLRRIYTVENDAKLAAAFVGVELYSASHSDRVVLVTATDDLRRRLRQFKVAGVFKSGMFDYDSGVVIIPLDDAMRFVDARGVSGLSIKLDDYRHCAEVKAELLRRFWKRWGCNVYTWEDKRATFLAAVHMERIVMAIILTFIMIVAGFCIFAILTMTVFEKRKDIGILKAVGMTRRGVGLIFLVDGLTIGVLGSALGLGLGMLIIYRLNAIEQFIKRATGWTPFPRNVYYFDQLPTDRGLTVPLLICAAAITLTLIFSVIPAWRAARLDPVETLRFE